MGRSANLLVVAGALLVLLGIVALAIPVFTTHSTKDVATIGDIKIQSEEKEPHVIPRLASGGALALGVVLLGAGIVQRRSS